MRAVRSVVCGAWRGVWCVECDVCGVCFCWCVCVCVLVCGCVGVWVCVWYVVGGASCVSWCVVYGV